MHRLFAFAWLAAAPLQDAKPQDAPLPEFDVASIKPIDLKARNAIDLKFLPSGRLIITAASVQQLIAAAYGGLQLYQVTGPAWISSEFYNLEAEGSENDNGQQAMVTAMGRPVPLKTMLRLRSLLFARFHLQAHFEERDHTVYDLLVAKGGPKLSPPKNPTDRCSGGVMKGAGSIIGENCNMSWLADRLARFIFQTDVFDKTGLDGGYDFSFKFEPLGALAQPTADADAAGLPSLFTALQSAGLKLEARKTPVKTLVVDRVSKPSAN